MKIPFVRRSQSKGEPAFQLLPLTPSYDSANHEVYFKAIESALTGENRKTIKNIALTGSYGVGKSSILQAVAATHEESVVQLSLSTLGLPDEDDTPTLPPTKATSTTNRIQKEIVKQLLYREDPDKTPGSRFRRIGRFRKRRGIGIAILAALALTTIFYLTGWTSQLVELVEPYWDPMLWAHLILLVIFTGVVFALEAAFHNRLQIQSFTAGNATISLSGDSATYFDQYLDEIIYFFEVTKSDIVIFEDIDRFDDPHIFETLRALNSLLNGAKQLDGRSIRFIYAIKDSIFDELGMRAARAESGVDASQPTDAADAEIARANRTKFFDLVIPVVPFITHRSARDLMVRVMSGIEHNISPELIDLAARHLADMRLIKNVRNEFLIFRQKILFGKESVPGLAEDQLFAMMLYKSTHLTDFEAIKAGRSNLDYLYADGRKLIANNIATLEREALQKRQQIVNIDSVTTRSEELGDNLLNYIKRIARHLNVPVRDVRTLTFGGQTRSDDDLRSVGFWKEFVDSEGALDVVFINPNYQQQSASFQISRADASEVMGNFLSLNDWQESDRTRLKERLDEISKAREFLAHADMRDLMMNEEYKLDPRDDASESFLQLAQGNLESELARKLVSAGYINRDFTLYTSTYYAERVSSQATNFIIHNLDSNVTDAHFNLAPADVEAVLRERGEFVLHERGIYNIDIFDHLLKAGDPRGDVIIQTLTAIGNDEKSFLRAYFTGGKEQESLVCKLAERWPPTFVFIISEAEIDESIRLQLLNAGLEHMAHGLNYVVVDNVREYFEEHYSQLPVFTSSGTNAQAASLVTGLLIRMGAWLTSLELLGPEVRRAVIAESLYLITRDNLLTAIGGTQGLALDHIREVDPVVYDYILGHMPDYLAALKEAQPASPTIETVDAFEAILEDVLEHAEDLLPEVIAAASPECQVPNLADVSEAAWPVLAELQRFPATFENVKAYVDTIGQVDQPLARLLKTVASIDTLAESEESAREGLATGLLAASGLLSEPWVRIKLVLSLDLEQLLPVTSIKPESGQLTGLLISEGIVEDDAASFSLTLGTDWPTREFAISKSEQFSSFMTASEVPASDVASLMKSCLVPDIVKTVLINRSDEFVPIDDYDALTAIAEYAVRHQTRLAIELVVRMSTVQVESPLLVQALEPLLPYITNTQIADILKNIGGNYSKLSERNGRHPRIEHIGPNIALVEKLKEFDIVSTYEVSGDEIVVHMKQQR